MIKITDVRVWSVNNGGNFLGNASITLDGQFVVTGFKIMNGRNGVFAMMPSVKMDRPKDPTKPYKDTAFALNKEFRDYICSRIIEAYKSKQNNGGGGYEEGSLPF